MGFLLKSFSPFVYFQITLDKVYILSTLPKLSIPLPAPLHIRRWFKMTVHFYFESVWDTILNSFNSFSKYLFHNYYMPGCEATKVTKTQHLPSILISLSQKSELGDSLTCLWGSECFSVLS